MESLTSTVRTLGLPPVAAREICAFLGEPEVAVERRATISRAAGTCSAEMGQLILSSIGLRCATLFERCLKREERSALSRKVELITILGNVFAVNGAAFRGRIEAIQQLAASGNLGREFPIVVFVGSHHRRPRPPTTLERDVWVRRMLVAVLCLLHSISVRDHVTSASDVIGNSEGDAVFVCPVSLCGWLLEYPVVYDVCGPYDEFPCDDIIDSVLRRLDTPEYAKIVCDRMSNSRWQVPLQSGNCLAGEQLSLVTAQYSIDPCSSGLPLEFATVSFSYPTGGLCEGDFGAVVRCCIARWKLCMVRRADSCASEGSDTLVYACSASCEPRSRTCHFACTTKQESAHTGELRVTFASRCITLYAVAL
jgi:hypothetical protein